MERHEASGQFYNWYDHRTGAKLTVWPSSGDPLTPILSSVDNGWLAAGLRVVANSVPEVADDAWALYDSMDFGFYYRADVNRILFHYAPDTGAVAVLLRHDRQREPDRDATSASPRARSRQQAYFGQWRTFPDTCDWSWQETKPLGVTRARTSASTCSRAPTRTRTSAWCRAGAARCSRR